MLTYLLYPFCALKILKSLIKNDIKNYQLTKIIILLLLYYYILSLYYIFILIRYLYTNNNNIFLLNSLFYPIKLYYITRKINFFILFY